MPRRVFLHIGTPKSGTTYLQDRFALNRDAIAKAGLTYVTTRTGDHFEAALDLIEERWAGQIEVARGQWAVLVAEAKRTTGDILISQEILAAASPEQVAKVMSAFAEDEVHVVLTARDLARQIPAEWQELIKHRSRKSFKKFMIEISGARRSAPTLWFWRVQSIPDILTRWGNGLAPEQVHVVTVPPKDGPPGELWTRFSAVVGIDPRVAKAESTNFNASLGVAEASMVRRLNKQLSPKVIPRAVYIDLVRELVVRGALGDRKDSIPVVVPAPRWRFIDTVTGEWLDWIQGAGVDVVGDLDDLVPVRPGPDHVWVHPDEPPADQVADAAIDSLAAVIAGVAPTHTSPVRRIARRLLRG
jgi:vacuolar-type H+-ATPase subunit F/Vma7